MPDVCARLLLIGVLVSSSAPLLAQSDQPPAAPAQAKPRPRIGLALGGGSARGLAHIGVLEWFERHHIPIDMIAGTSMGGLVAGAYASGMTPAEIRDLMRTTDWDVMFLSDSPFRYKTFRRKQDKRAYPSQLEFGLKGGFRLPGGLNPGQEVAMLLDRIAAPYPPLDSFDQLPTPYRCVATDLRKGEAVVLSRGSLSRAMRATMAIPGVFTPVTYDEWLLVDGGALNNIPADVVREMNADIVIAVNVAADSAEEEDPNESLFTLLGRTIDTMMSTGTRRALKSADLIIDPDLKGLGSTDWRRSDDLAERGSNAAEAQAAVLTRYAMDPAAHAQFLAERQARRRTALPTPTFVDVVGEMPPAMKRSVERAFAAEVGQPMDLDRLRTEILTVSGTDRFEYLTFQQIERNGEPGLVITARPKDYGPPFLALGLELSNIDSSNFAVNFGGRVITYDLIGAGSEARLDVRIGTEQRVVGELYRRFGTSDFFVAPRAYYQRTARNGYQDGRFVAEYRVTRTGAGIDVGHTFGRRAELRFGYDGAAVQGRLRVGDPMLPEAEGAERAMRLQFIYDRQTSPVVPSRGLYVRSVLRHYFDTADITAETEGLRGAAQSRFIHPVRLHGSWFRRAKGEDRIFLGFGGGSSFNVNPLFNDFALGGLLRLGAFNNDELRGPNFTYFNAGYLKQVGRLTDVIGGNIYLGGWLESGSAWDDWDAVDWHNNITAGLIIESLLGPIFAGLSADTNNVRYYVAIGPLFR